MTWDIWKWAKELSFNPRKLTKKNYSYGEFVTRLVKVSFFPIILSTVIGVFSILILDAATGGGGGMFAGLAIVGTLVGNIFGYILAAVIGPFIGAAVVHFFGKMVFGLMKGDYKKTYNAMAYSSATRLLFIWIPFGIGTVVSLIWGIVTQVYALANQHKITPRRALLVTLIPIIIVAVVFVLIFAAAVATFGPEVMNSWMAGESDMMMNYDDMGPFDASVSGN